MSRPSFAFQVPPVAKFARIRCYLGRQMELNVTFGTVLAVVEKLMRDGRVLDDLMPAEKTFWLVWTFKAESDNGGFHQFFFNHSGENAQDTVDALTDIGAPEIAGMLQDAIDRFPAGRVPQDTTTRRGILETMGIPCFRSMDEAFFKRTDMLDDLLIAHVRVNMVETVLPYFISEASSKADDEFKRSNHRAVVELLSQYESHLQGATLAKLKLSRKRVAADEKS
jgi:hypothetical protein